MDYKALSDDNSPTKDASTTMDVSPTTVYEEMLSGGRTRTNNMAGAPDDKKPERNDNLGQASHARDGQVMVDAGTTKIKPVP